jgi:elongation factor Ts
MNVPTTLIKELREKTKVGFMACKNALETANLDMDKAEKVLKQNGLIKINDRLNRNASEGIIDSYIHKNRIGVMLEVNCETDFVSRTDEFKQMVKDIAMNICALNPLYISRDDVPQSFIDEQRELHMNKLRAEGKSEIIISKIIENVISKDLSEICLLEQPFVKDTSKTINDLINDMMMKTGEKIVVKRFVRYEITK